MEVTFNILEVIHILSTRITIESDLLHLMISHFMDCCDNITEPSAQVHLVRLVCLFLQSLLKNNVIQLKDYKVELEEFCLRQAKVKEAAQFFKSIKDEQ